MPLNPPRLDDRSFDGLVAELIARIPAHTPEWTNPRVGDPGRTLIELFAWLGDTLLYRANLIPERQRLVFLKLLGIQIRPAVAARGMIRVSPKPGSNIEAVTLRSGASVSGPPNFETRGELTVLPVSAQVYAKRLLDESERAALGTVIADVRGVLQGLRPDLDASSAAPYVTTPLFADAAPAPGGFDLITETADRALWLAVLAPTAPTREPTRSMLLAGNTGRPFTLNIGFVPMTAAVETLDALPPRRPIGHVWEVSTAERVGSEPAYRALDVLRDTTNGLTRDGVLQLGFAAGSLEAPSNDTRLNPDAGMGAGAPPRVDDPRIEERLICWIRLRPKERLESLAVSWLAINAVEIEQSQTTRSLVVGKSDGTADQIVSLNTTAVDATSLVLEIEEGDRGFQVWQRVDDVSAFGRDSRVYSLDAEAGSVRFGDGVRGRVPELGMRLRVREMRSGGGAQGNLPPGKLKVISGRDPAGERVVAALDVSQPLVTRGGADAETLIEAERRIPASLRHRNRAVTADDFRSIAASTPGVFVGRVEVMPRFKPQQRRRDVPGVVSILVIPASRSQSALPPAPRPDRPFLEAVHAWLSERRAVGTELYVIGPEYVPIGISVGIDIRSGFGDEETLSAVRLALRAFLWSLPPGGVQGTGWELGATVLAPQLEVAVARVPGVASVRGVRLFIRRSGAFEPAPAVASGALGVQLQPWQLPELLAVVALSGSDAPEDLRGVADPFASGGTGGAGSGNAGAISGGIGIPVVPEVC